MKFHSRFSFSTFFAEFWQLLLLMCFLMLGAPHAVAQESAAGAPAVPAASATTSPAPPAPVNPPATVDAPKVTARREDEPETPAAPAAGANAPAPNPNLTWLQRTVASVSGIPTETSNAAALTAMTAERDSLRQQLATAQAAVEAANASATAAQASAAAAQAELTTLNGFLTQLREAGPAAFAPAANPAAALPPAAAAAQAAVTAGVAAELRAIGQPAASLPGPGATPPQAEKPAEATPLIQEEDRRAFFAAETARRMPKNALSN